jgi:spore cortex protein
LNKKVLYTLSTAFLLSGLTACNTNGTDEGAMGNNQNTNGTRPIGYYSDENTNGENGNAILPDRDNDGPVTEMLDRAGDEGTNRGTGNIGTRDDGFIDNHRNGTRNVGFNENSGTKGNLGARGWNGQNTNRNSLLGYGNNIGADNPTRQNATEDNGMTRDNRFARSDYNYHGQMANRDNNTRASYNNNYNGRLAEQISDRVQNVNNVEDVRTIINGNEVLVAIDTNDRNNQKIEQQVRDAVRSIAAGKDVRVVSDENIFTRARNIDNNLRDGGPTDDLDADVRDMFREIGNELDDAVRTPFRDTK